MVAWWRHSIIPNACISSLILSEVKLCSHPCCFLPRTLINEVEKETLMKKKLMKETGTPYTAAADQKEYERSEPWYSYMKSTVPTNFGGT